jgi:hypothetical protein
MNPARTLGSAIAGNTWTAWWIYFIAPPIAMLAAAEVYVRTAGLKTVLCAKFDHSGIARCIFNCRFDRIRLSGQDNEVREESDNRHIEVTKRQQDFGAIAGLF